MEPTDHSLESICFRCQRQALTFDEKNRPLCGRHALFFVTAPRMRTKDNETQTEARSTAASERS